MAETKTAEAKRVDVVVPDAIDQAMVPSTEPTAMDRPVSARAETLAIAFRGLMPQSMGEVIQLAGALVGSAAIPKSSRMSAPAILTIIMTGIEVGLTPLQALNNIFNIGGNLGMKANLQLALIRGSGLLLHFDEGFDRTAEDDNEWFGWCEVVRKGDVHFKSGRYWWDNEPYQAGDPVVRRKHFTVAMARNWKVVSYESEGSGDTRGGNGRGQRQEQMLADKDNYVSMPDRMYPMRARTWIFEQVFGDVLKGLPTYETMDGPSFVDAEVVNRAIETDGQDVGGLLAEIKSTDSEMANAIEQGFALLKMAPGRMLAKLTEYRGRPQELVTWLRDEWGRTRGKGNVGTAKAEAAAVSNLTAVVEKAGAAAVETLKASVEGAVASVVAKAVEAKAAAAETKPVAVETKPEPTETSEYLVDPLPDDVDDAMPTATPFGDVSPAAVERAPEPVAETVTTPAGAALARTRKAFTRGDRGQMF